ncbi:MAG: hypothetical protein MUF54_06965 [Polyangiaceae bacterium]|jgi:serine/threonine-protein kinase RsbT|nr:hypothetical protein [Polyangiaceae bacterium]
MSDRVTSEAVRAVVDETTETAIATHADIVAARRAGRDLAAQLGFKPVDCAQIATAISELARNISLYAGSGRILLRVLDDHGRRGIEVVAEGAKMANRRRRALLPI